MQDRIDGRMNEWMNERMNVKNNGYINEWMNVWTIEGMNDWMNFIKQQKTNTKRQKSCEVGDTAHRERIKLKTWNIKIFRQRDCTYRVPCKVSKYPPLDRSWIRHECEWYRRVASRTDGGEDGSDHPRDPENKNTRIEVMEMNTA